MATYAIGDIHGCYGTLQALLRRVQFNPSRDNLWLVGDLVNRGPASLQVLRWAFWHQDQVQVVLGNHELHLLACWLGLEKPPAALLQILKAPDSHKLLHWLCSRPLLYQQNGWGMVHAGILPDWSWQEALEHAQEVQQTLASPRLPTLLWRWVRQRSCVQTRTWHNHLDGYTRLAALLSIFTCMRFCTSTTQMDFSHNGAPDIKRQEAFASPSVIPAKAGIQPDNSFYQANRTRPWFLWRQQRHSLPNASSSHTNLHEPKIIFGHWAALGFYQGNGVICLDSGCCWGRMLTAYRLQDGAVFQQPLCDEI